MRQNTRTRVLGSRVTAALATALLLAASACTGSETAGAPAASPTAEKSSPTPPPSTAAPGTLSASASPTEPSATESTGSTATETENERETEKPASSPSDATVQPPPPGSGPEAMVLRAGEMPGLNDQHSWKTIGTADEEPPKPLWACQVTDFASIGATNVAVRRFVGQPGGGDSAKARSEVITFADPQSAARGFAVLRAWHDRCEDQLRQQGHTNVRVDASPTPVDVSGGDAEWRLAIYGPVKGDPNAGFFDATGYVKEGSRISLTTMVNVGQDYNYPPGKEPIVGAVQNSAVKLLG